MPLEATARLSEALEIGAGIVCVVGAGGKKSTLYRLASELEGRIALTATTLMARFPATLEAHVIVSDVKDTEARVLSAAADHRIVGYAHPAPEHPGRIGGVSPDLVTSIHQHGGFETTLVKADGARRRLIKAPGPDEPVIPDGTALVIFVVSARAIGVPLDAGIAHRLERLAAVSGARIGEIIRPEHVAKLLTSERGALQNAGSARLIPLINMVDDDVLEAQAAEAARRALRHTDRFDRVVLASLRSGKPVRRVVTRGSEARMG